MFLSMISKIFPILEHHIDPADTLILGVSGGPDSTALLHALVDFSRTRNVTLVAAHVNHGIRGAEADGDCTFVRELAKKYNIKCEVKRVKLAGKTHQEELGRNIRRDFFEKLRGKYKARWILTAHTQDDQLETIVLNFLRGSGPAGLAGMKMINGFYFKPLLRVSKKEILAYLKAHKLKFCKDRTNNDTRYRRNFLRKRILPLFSKINPNFRQTLLSNAQTFREIQEWMEEEAARVTLPFSAKEFLRLPPAIQKTALQMAYRKFSAQHYRLSSVKIAEIQRLIARGIGQKKVPLGKHGWAVLEEGKITMKP